MTRLTLVSALVILTLASPAPAHAEQRRMIKLTARQQPSSTPPSSFDANSPLSRADAHLGIAQDSDAEAMRQMMRHKAESVIASFAGDSLPSHAVYSILSGEHASVHPGSLGNISWSMDMFEKGSTLPVGSSSSSSSTYSYHSESSFSSSWSSSSSDSNDDSDPNKSDSGHSDGMLTVDNLLHTFFHADHVSTLFDQVQSQTKKPLNKQSKKEIIKKSAPMLHKTIEKVASHRGWGMQDARFAQMHLEEGEGKEAFKDYNMFVKTMRSALISPNDAEQQA